MIPMLRRKIRAEQNNYRVATRSNNLLRRIMYTGYVKEILELLKAPPAPVDVDQDIWTWNRRIMQIDLPKDYLEFCTSYGSGTLSLPGFSLQIVSLFRRSYALCILEICRSHFRFRDSCEIEDVPFGIYPESGGLLPFALNPNGYLGGWITDGDPEEWKVIYMTSYEVGQYEIMDLGFTGFVHNLLRCEHLPMFLQGKDSWSAPDAVYESSFYLDKGYTRLLE